ncbi:hypothetical protein BV22DRAFT_1005738 [Leucogyrophana mollusca]|uniref:Uncharacterized protein n=1 Tax=Leucogyrophana mollusca TaxID=85980 RepID=A0ACB8BR74_9AGAM|nr:hypothetical protein BV22DRAFT_1005738 [Leucogyrophana mollusca]
MLDVNHLQTKPSSRSTINPPPSSRNSSSSVHNDAISLSSRDNSEDRFGERLTVGNVGDSDEHDHKLIVSKKSRVSLNGSKPASTAAAGGTKPKSSKPPRARSPSPTPPPPPPPLQTIRLQIKLGGPDNYEVDIASFAKATGQRQPTPPPAKADTSESEGEGDGETDDKNKPKKKRKKATTTEYYDTSDPFIDDSELAIDQRTTFAQTKQSGFYVSSGEVALLKDKCVLYDCFPSSSSPTRLTRTPKKPKSKKPTAAQTEAGASTAGPSKLAPAKQEGTKDHPISLLGNDDKVGKKRKNYTVVEENGKKRKVVDMRDFHPDLQAAIEHLKVAISQESWEAKGKFPPSIKPVLAEVALKAVNLGEYDEDFFNLMPALFPYNRYTMTKLIKRTIFSDHLKILTTRQDELLEQLATLTKEGFPKAREEYEKSVVAWGMSRPTLSNIYSPHRTERRQEKAKADAEAGSTPGDPPHHEDAGSGGEGENPGTVGKDGNKEPHPPSQKYRLTDAMKSIVWHLVMLSNECCRLENEKNELEGNNAQVSEQGSRKILYQKIVAAFPANWLNSGQISREVSSMKKKMEKEAMEHES